MTHQANTCPFLARCQDVVHDQRIVDSYMKPQRSTELMEIAAVGIVVAESRLQRHLKAAPSLASVCKACPRKDKGI